MQQQGHGRIDLGLIMLRLCGGDRWLALITALGEALQAADWGSAVGLSGRLGARLSAQASFYSRRAGISARRTGSTVPRLLTSVFCGRCVWRACSRWPSAVTCSGAAAPVPPAEGCFGRGKEGASEAVQAVGSGW